MNGNVAAGSHILTKAALRKGMELAQMVLQREAAALQAQANKLCAQQAVQDRLQEALYISAKYTQDMQGKMVLVGVGKSGLVARKIAATLTSVGVPAIYLHPIESMHGDLGLVIPGSDVIMVLSYSGNTPEIHAFLQLEQVQKCTRIVMTANASSALIPLADVWLDCSAAEPLKDTKSSTESEAWPAIPAPTSSTTLMMALGDAFALALVQIQGLTCTTFAKNHPGGHLGKILKEYQPADHRDIGEVSRVKREE
ncbi:Uncharacterized protein MSYG_2544 [Malassezia sympodialis ATCC 42132]|uniref:SIS domain-containing protein n=1 Tax=Malassezia sympodialis (strain ATCC 42132) TaxID=1230383 RepID=A0A1M8A703_MALS4|nr:Uncharacterized protein MSYG_2544 [Malassezia sympodialis ATCC 42132]